MQIEAWNLFYDEIYRKDFLVAVVERLLQLSKLFHESLGSYGCVDFGYDRKLWFAAVVWRDGAAVMKPKGINIRISNDHNVIKSDKR